MAIVHSRFKRVFIGVPHPAGRGGLGGRLGEAGVADGAVIALQLEGRLNHRFSVWRGVLREECQALAQS